MEETFYHESAETLAQGSQRGSGGPIAGSIQSQVGWGSEQPGLVEISLLTARWLG